MTPIINPLGDRVLIRPVEKTEPEKEKKIGGIIIPDSTQKSTLAGIDNPHSVWDVLAVGDKCERVKGGDRIVIKTTNAYPVQVGDAVYQMVREGDVMATVTI